MQLGLTATPERDVNSDTYRYFGDPVYMYSLREGINDGFLTPFKVNRIQTTFDQYTYVSDDKVMEGVVEAGKTYTEADFNRTIGWRHGRAMPARFPGQRKDYSHHSDHLAEALDGG